MIRETCGTVEGWLAHQATSEPPCGFCVRAERVALIEAERNLTPSQTSDYHQTNPGRAAS
jgi:hypothetical protein